jgi:hypothetical protein
MGLVYFSIPIIGGYYTWLYVNQKSLENIGKNGSKLKISSGSGSTNTSIPPETGVKLVQSTDTTQQQNKDMLQAFLKQQQRRGGGRQNHTKQQAKEEEEGGSKGR